jgi:hypothetical protein
MEGNFARYTDSEEEKTMGIDEVNETDGEVL